MKTQPGIYRKWRVAVYLHLRNNLLFESIKEAGVCTAYTQNSNHRNSDCLSLKPLARHKHANYVGIFS